ncbi:ubiquinol oxidase subunit II [Labrys monachus]|uniref:Ubiquinol oxidase polypeptide II n=1 Tax=Labrys monachus TaxID=217067 RepID=A0ABU0FMR1_9HYPH|nr:ubiquinol oxidase subunit II [Labrys monachus]MDQ0395340.1 cytochrome o ubiquinol oxidase subunit 2 [Labrys monachus]
MARLRILALLPILLLLGACNAIVLSPPGDIAAQQGRLVMISTGLMLVIILPVMALTVLFAWRYRQSNKAAIYKPDWDHSTQLELVIWSAPLLIIICLGAITWASTHLLDPYRPLGNASAGKAAGAAVKPLAVEVVALDWKWLFIYPEYGIASVNELAAPAGRPIDFRITSSSVMNSFYIPALAGQIYAMPGMQTRLHAVMGTAGTYEGFSANYSGAGFSGMRFAFHSQDGAAFDKWTAEVKAAGGMLDRSGYLALERPSENEPVRHYGAVDPGLFAAILNMCVEPGKMCMSEMSAIDAKGGLGLEAVGKTLPLTYDKYARRGAVFGPARSYVASLCTPDDIRGEAPRPVADPAAPNASPLRGAGLPWPGLLPSRFQLPASASRPSNS